MDRVWTKDPLLSPSLNVTMYVQATSSCWFHVSHRKKGTVTMRRLNVHVPYTRTQWMHHRHNTVHTVYTSILIGIQRQIIRVRISHFTQHNSVRYTLYNKQYCWININSMDDINRNQTRHKDQEQHWEGTEGGNRGWCSDYVVSLLLTTNDKRC